MGNLKICMLLYADDIVISSNIVTSNILISENKQKLQKLLDHVHQWCKNGN